MGRGRGPNLAIGLIPPHEREPIAAPEDHKVLGVHAGVDVAEQDQRHAAGGALVEPGEDALPGRRRRRPRRLLLDDGEAAHEVVDAAELAGLAPAVAFLGAPLAVVAESARALAALGLGFVADGAAT